MVSNAIHEPRQFCTFYLGDTLLGIEVQEVQEVLRPQEMTRIPLAPHVVRGLMNLRGQIVTGIDLRKQFQLPDAPYGDPPMNVVIRRPAGIISLLVDQIGDVVEVEAGRYDAPPETLSGSARELILGTYQLDKGLLLVLNTDRVAEISSSTPGVLASA